MTQQSYGDMLSREHTAKKRLFFWLKDYDVEIDHHFDVLTFDFEGSKFWIEVKEMCRY